MPRTLHLDAADPAHLARAARMLREGGLVAFPTETVYGLGANALDPRAVAGIFAAKQRPRWDPLIVHIADRSMLAEVAQGSARLAVEELARRFWPGPLTLLLPRTQQIPDAVTAGRALVGVRVPAHPVAQQLLRQAGVPVAAPSANRFGHTSPTSAAHVLADLDGRIDAVLDGGETEVGVESTVAEATETGLTVYRPGAVTVEMLREVLIAGAGPTEVRLYTPAAGPASPQSLPSPGVGMRHYAPRARLLLVPVPDHQRQPVEVALLEAIDRALAPGARVGVLLPEGWSASGAELTYAWGPWLDKPTLARRLFAGLRALDDQGATEIVAPLPSAGGLGEALRDRLQKAARPS